MAYRRFRPRPRRYRRKFSQARRSYASRRGRTGRGGGRRFRKRGTMTSARRIRDVASTKKRDLQVGRTTAEDDLEVDNTTATLRIGHQYYIWCPSYLEQNVQSTGAHEDRHKRNRRRIFFRGIKDNVFITATSPIMWRRVVFWMNDQFLPAQPHTIFNEVDAQSYPVRNLSQFFPETTHSDFADYVWAGTVDRDFTEATRFHAPLDKASVKVVSDRRETINPNFGREASANLGKIRNARMWHEINRMIAYRDHEDGQKIRTSGWAGTSPRDPGNLYIMDMFSTAHAEVPSTPGQVVGGFRTESCLYWHES
ncbi:capsid protein [Chicken virus mg7_41u]|nr:capsid protein [Chicken virus mg7_41u]